MKFFSKWKSFHFFPIFTVLSSHCGIANWSLKIFSLCTSIHFFYFATVLRRTGLKIMYARFIFHFVTIAISHAVACSIVKHGNIPHQPFLLSFRVWLCFFLNFISFQVSVPGDHVRKNYVAYSASLKCIAWWKEARFEVALPFLILWICDVIKRCNQFIENCHRWNSK